MEDFLSAADEEVYAPLAPNQWIHLEFHIPRQGMVIFVPPGAKRDKTRSPVFYEGVGEHLAGLGVPQV